MPVRKMHLDDEGVPFRVYVIFDDLDLTYPNEGIEIDEEDEAACKFHQEFIDNHELYLSAYKYENGEFKKRSLSEFKKISDEFVNPNKTTKHQYLKWSQEHREICSGVSNNLDLDSAVDPEETLFNSLPIPPKGGVKTDLYETLGVIPKRESSMKSAVAAAKQLGGGEKN